MNFDLNAIWTRGIDLVRDNLSLLVVIAGVFLLLPTVAMYLFIPDMQTFADPTADPDIVAARMGEALGPLIGGGLVAGIIQFAGYGAMIALMSNERPTVGESIATGFKIVPSTLVVMLVFMLAYVIGGVIVMIPFAIISGVAGSPALGMIGVIPVLLYVIWLMARLSMTMPALVLEDSLNPFKAMGRSIALTGPKQWQIMLFWVVLVVIFFVISLLFNGFFGVVAALMGTGTTAMLIVGLANGITGMASGVLICALSVAMHGQLAGQGASGIEETFE